MKSFLQSPEWLEFQKSVGHPAWRFDDGKISAGVIQHDLPFRFNYLYIPHGPEINFNAIQGTIDHELQLFVDALKKLAREQKSIFVKIEPLDGKVPEVLHKFKFKKSSKEIQPHRTVIMNLDASGEELLAAMHHKTRYNIRVAEKNGLKWVKRNDPDAFWKLLKHTAKHDNFSTHSKEYYEKLCHAAGLDISTFFIEHDGKPIAGLIGLVSDATMYYLHGAMDRDQKYKPMMAPYLLHWETIKWAKSCGIKKYDWWGIDAQKWPGVTRFKLGWGGRQVYHPGAFDLSVRGFWFLIYKIFRKIF